MIHAKSSPKTKPSSLASEARLKEPTPDRHFDKHFTAGSATAMAKNDSEWLLLSSQYLGEISALCFVRLPSNLSSFPYLLAGSGSQVLLYDLEAGKLIRSFQVVDGIRVHGISCEYVNSEEGSSSTTVTYRVVLYGEKKVKLFKFELSLDSEYGTASYVDLNLVQSLPRLSHWVLDVTFLKDCNGNRCLAIGCSDNSVRVWDISNARITLEVYSPERCLLYTLRLWGDNLQALQVASGTIFNEIIVWKLDLQEDHSNLNSSISECVELNHQEHKTFHICRLIGHEGSIFRIEWSSSGSKLVSVSDDRSARIWTVHAKQKDSNIMDDIGPVLYGHSARVWDCCISDSFIITASEDCTCRVWGPEGRQLKMIKEHIGRGIWRCLYDPLSSLLVTAGFDSAIKVHQLHTTLSGSLEANPEAKDSNDKIEMLNLHIPNSSEHNVLMDSKSEYVRCLRFTCEDTLYVATNQGYLYHTRLSNTKNVKFTKLLQVSEGSQVVCIDLLSENKSDNHKEIDDWVALGDGKGKVTIVRVFGDICAPELGVTLTWSAGMERQLLGIHWCKSLGYRYVFTADPRGILKLWKLCDSSLSSCDDSRKTFNVCLIAQFYSCFGARVMCLDASVKDEVLVCGDLRGNLILFRLSKQILLGSSAAPKMDISPLIYFKGAHGISTVSKISVAILGANQLEIRSTGGDGCICYLEYDKDRESLEFMGLKQVKELSLIHSVSGDNDYTDLMSCNHAAGFASADFIIWNLITEAKVVQIPCGGWRRPHSYLLGDVPEIKHCFAYVKDEVIHIHRHWVSESKQKIFPQNLHMQFHGREIHTLCFISETLQVGVHRKKSPFHIFSWIATGCEDGTVRLTRYSPGVEDWSTSKLLGEHVGGSAVRSICSVSKVHLISSAVDNIPEVIYGQDTPTQDKENPFLLISVGAKRVLTSWLLRNRNADPVEESAGRQKCENGGNCKLPIGASSSLSFQWLSTDMPTKNCSAHGKVTSMEKNVVTGKNNTPMNNDKKTVAYKESVETESVTHGDKNDDDWRYLAVTSFLVKCPGSRVTVCFVVVACSDATLVLRALVLPHRLWFDVALLVPVSSPVLTLQHVVVPIQPSKEGIQIGNLCLVISGATDGSTTFWDLTESVEAFVRQVSSLHVEKFIDCQKRPRTGRGSQGGRRRRTLSITNPKKKTSNNLETTKARGEANDVTTKSNDMDESSVQAIHTVSHEPESNTVDYASEIHEVQPMHVFRNVHQSGVNCLHVSDTKKCPSTENGFQFYVVSGGDDQAIQCLRVEVLQLSNFRNSEIVKSDVIDLVTESTKTKNLIYLGQKINQDYAIRLFNHSSVSSAHSSAIKGIWTDGTWIFSTGLDQRVRIWLIEEHGKLTEHAHIIVSVPEPEALNARACGRDNYQIAVAGRGMQVVEFSASNDVDEEQQSRHQSTRD